MCELLPLDEVVEEVLDPLFHLRFLQRNRVALIGDLHHQLTQLVQLTLDLEEALRHEGEPKWGQTIIRAIREKFEWEERNWTRLVGQQLPPNTCGK